MDKKLTAIIILLPIFAVTTVVVLTAVYFFIIKDDSNLADYDTRVEYIRDNGTVSPEEREETKIYVTEDYVEYATYKGDSKTRSEKIDITKDQYEEMMALIDDIEQIKANKECTGGPIISLDIYKNDKKVLDGYWSECVVTAGGEIQPDGSLNKDPQVLEDYVMDNLL